MSRKGVKYVSYLQNRCAGNHNEEGCIVSSRLCQTTDKTKCEDYNAYILRCAEHLNPGHTLAAVTRCTRGR